MVILWNATQIGCFGLHKMSLNGNRTAEYPGRWTGAGSSSAKEDTQQSTDMGEGGLLEYDGIDEPCI